jgi:hypothetical protein
MQSYKVNVWFNLFEQRKYHFVYIIVTGIVIGVQVLHWTRAAVYGVSCIEIISLD